MKHITLIVLVSGLLLVGCGDGGVPTPGIDQTPDPSQGDTSGEGVEVAAYVNGQPILMETFSRELARFEAGRSALGFEVSDEVGYKQQVLDLLVEQELMRQEAQNQGIMISDEAVDAELNAMMAETGQEYFDSWLNTNYYTIEEFREVLRLDLMTNQLLSAVVANVPLTAEHVHAAHILVTSEAAAQTVLERLEAGDGFEALAAEFSTDVTTRDRGGDLGWFPRGGLLVPEVEEAAFSLAAGEVSQMVRSAWGYHFVRTLEFDSNREVDPETRQRLVEKAIEDWRIALHAGADIQQVVSFTS